MKLRSMAFQALKEFYQMQADGKATQHELKAQLALAHTLGSGQAQVQVPSVPLAHILLASAQSQTQSQQLAQEVHPQAKHQWAATPRTGIATVVGNADYNKGPEKAGGVATLPVLRTSEPTPGRQIPAFGAAEQAHYGNQQTAAAAAFAHNSQRVQAGQAHAVHTIVPGSGSSSCGIDPSAAEVGVVHHSWYCPPTSDI